MAENQSLNDKLKVVQDMLTSGLEEMFQNNENFKRFLELMSRLPHYSLNNLALIYAQKPNASMVQGFKQWKQLDRYVNKGEKGLYIYAPSFKNKKEIIKDENGEPIKDENGKNKVKITKVLTGYIPVTVFDISQTGGKELPKAKDFVRDIKTGQKKMDYGKLYELVKNAIAANAKVPVIDDTITEILASKPDAKGYYSHVDKHIVIRPDLSIEHKFKTLIHEFAHSQLHAENSPFKDSSKSEKEIHAESVAFCVSAYYGLDTSDYSIGYIATWARDLERAKDGLNEIRNLVEGTVKSIDNIISKHELELLNENIQVENKQNDIVNTSEINQVNQIDQDIKEFEPIRNYKELFTNAVPLDYIENFAKNMDLTVVDNPPYFEILDKQTLSFITGQFVKADPSNDNYEFQIQGGKVLTGKDFETGDYLITNLLSNGTDINVFTKDFDDQFFIDEKDNKYNISIYKADGTKEVIFSSDNLNDQSLSLTKSQYDYMAIEKTLNQLQFANSMMKRIDLVMNKNTRDNLTSSYQILQNKLFIEDKNTLNRRFHEIEIPHDRNTIMLLKEYLRASPTTNSLEDLQNNLTASSEQASQRLGMNNDLYTYMLTNAVNQVIDHTMSPKQSLTEKISDNTIILTREEYSTKDYIESLKMTEELCFKDIGRKEDIEKHYQDYADKQLGHLLTINNLDTPVNVMDCQKMILRNEATSYQLKVNKNGENKKVTIADSSGLFPYLIQKTKEINLDNVLKKTSGVQALSIPEREKNINELIGNFIDHKKKEPLIESESADIIR